MNKGKKQYTKMSEDMHWLTSEVFEPNGGEEIES